MSRIGLKPVEVPAGVTVAFKDGMLSVKGSKGEMTQEVLPAISFDIQDKQILVKRADESKKAKSLHGLYRNLLQNMIQGVTAGFQKVLVINGVGYRAEVAGKQINFNLGYSHPIAYMLPEGIAASVEGNNKITVSGIDKAVVGQVAAEIRGLRPPEPYKAKGIKYEDEQIRRKVGKTGVK